MLDSILKFLGEHWFLAIFVIWGGTWIGLYFIGVCGMIILRVLRLIDKVMFTYE